MDKIARRIRVVTEEQAGEFVTLYEKGLSANSIASQFGVSRKTVTYHLQRLGVARRAQAHLVRVHSCDERYFSQINTEEKAYWLGFLSADGYINRSKGNYTIGLALSARDTEHIQLFASCLGASAPIHSGLISGKGAEYVKLQINSKPMVLDLERLGVGPRKSFTIRAWRGPQYLLSHYWRGVTDGDGTIGVTGNKWRFGLCGSKPMMEDFAAYARRVSTSRSDAHQSRNIWTVQISGRPVVRSIVRVLYGNATIALPRKNELAQELLSERWATRPAPHNRRDDLDALAIRAEYESGDSTVTLGRRHGIADVTVARLVRQAGGTLRTRAEGQKAHYQKDTS